MSMTGPWHDPHARASEATDECANCGANPFSPNVEAFEVIGLMLCDEGASEALAAEDDGQPDEAQEWADFDREC